MLCLVIKKPTPSCIKSPKRTVKRRPCAKKKKKEVKKKQLKTPLDKRMRTLVEEVMQTISDHMYEGNDWVPEQDIINDILEKQTKLENVTEQEVKKALECGISFGVILRSSCRYSLPRKIQFMIEEGGVPDWTEYTEDWPTKPKRVRKKGRRRRNRSREKRKSRR